MVKPTREQFNDFKLAVLKFVTDLYLVHNKDLHPSLLLLTPEGYRKIFPLPMMGFENQHNKDNVADLILNLIRESKTNMICFASEGWCISKSGLKELDDSGATKEDILKIQPSKHKDKIEILSLFFASYDGKSSLMAFTINRDNESVRLIPREEFNDDVERCEGRFTNLMRKAYRDEDICNDCNVCDGNCKEDLNSEDYD